MLDYQLYGLNAGGYHITNYILHILSTLLLFFFLNRMTGAVWKSAFVAAFFALHPLHVESVAWIAERKDVLSAFFWMLTLCLYVYYTEKPILKKISHGWFFFDRVLYEQIHGDYFAHVTILLIMAAKRFDLKKNWASYFCGSCGKSTFFYFLAVFSVATLHA